MKTGRGIAAAFCLKSMSVLLVAERKKWSRKVFRHPWTSGCFAELHQGRIPPMVAIIQNSIASRTSVIVKPTATPSSQRKGHECFNWAVKQSSTKAENSHWKHDLFTYTGHIFLFWNSFFLSTFQDGPFACALQRPQVSDSCKRDRFGFSMCGLLLGNNVVCNSPEMQTLSRGHRVHAHFLTLN